MPKTVPGLNVQYPWSQLLLSGDKTVETRSYPLPQKHLNKELAIIETPGPYGKKNGISKAKVIGVIIFENSFQYKSRKDWESDYRRHRVPTDDPQFEFDSSVPKYGWVVKSVRKFLKPVEPPASRGIIFATACKIPSV